MTSDFSLGNRTLKIAILIPARFNSTRFPGKALHELDGTPMAKLVFQRCSCTGLDTFLVSDDKRICDLAGKRGLLTSQYCENGTARCAEAAQKLTDYDAFINVQGDMPDVTVDIIHKIANALQTSELVTAYTKMTTNELSNPNSVKLIHNNDHAIWMCRAPLTYGDRHIGIYGYSRLMLETYSKLPQSIPEKQEGLEQLRWLQARLTMKIIEVEFNGVEINEPRDVLIWEDNRKYKSLA